MQARKRRWRQINFAESNSVVICILGAAGLALIAATLPLVGLALLAGGIALGLVAMLGAGRRPAGRTALPSPAPAPSPVEAPEDRRAAWDRLHAERAAALADAAGTLARQIVAHGTPATADELDTAYDRYLADCRTRATRAGEASGADTLRAAIAARSDLERRATEVDARLARIDADLRRVAEQAGLVDEAIGAVAP